MPKKETEVEIARHYLARTLSNHLTNEQGSIYIPSLKTYIKLKWKAKQCLFCFIKTKLYVGKLKDGKVFFCTEHRKDYRKEKDFEGKL